jgi:hypothetical protein
LVVGCATTSLFGAEPPAYKIQEDKGPPSQFFPEIQREARRLDHLVVEAIRVPTRQSIEQGFPAATREFGRFVRADVALRLKPSDLEKLPPMLDYFADVLAANDGFPKQLPQLVVQRDGFTTMFYKFTGDPADNVGSITLNSGQINVVTSNGSVAATREGTVESLADAIAPYKLNAAAFTAHETRVRLLALADDWDAYFEQGRPQTFWDIAVTTLFEYRHIKTDHLTGPPARQWFVLHPNVVIENLDSAPDGSQLKGAVSIEWIGVNWWNLKIPFGISLSSLYSDRKDAADVGHGLTLYFANKYCIGWANHGGKNGFFVSLDALQLIDSKKSKLQNYRDQIGKYLK